MEPYRLAICEDDPLEGQHLFRVCGELLEARQIPPYAAAVFLG